jgi:hypothetical protein
MDSLALPLINVAAAIWVGAIVFQSFFVAPVLFRQVAGADASRFLRALFPRFYWLGLGCGAAMLAGTAAVGSAGRADGPAGWLLPATVAMLLAEAVSLWLVPRINAARDAGAAGAGRFRALHGLSVALTLAVLLLGIAILVALARGTI